MRFWSRSIATLRTYDWFLTVVVFMLLAVGLAAVYSVDLSKGESFTYFPTHLVATGLGIVAFFFMGRIHLTRFESGARLIYIGALLLLVSVLFLGATVRGTTGWFRVAGWSFQPAEFAKLALVFTLAWIISRQSRRFDRWEFVVSSGFATAFLAGLILLQPDLGTAMILGATWFGLLFLTGAKKRYLIGLAACFIGLLLLGWFFFFQDYQRGRFLAFLDPEGSPYAYNVRQSIIAIGAGELTGRGLGFGSQSQLHFLPEAQTDFIFSVIGEELGFVGASAILALFALMLWRLFLIAKAAKDDFGAYVALGVLLLFAVQMTINIGGAIGMLPITGVTLPLVSYGGSSLIMTLALLGAAQSVYRSGVQ